MEPTQSIFDFIKNPEKIKLLISANELLNLNKHNIEVDAATMRTSIEGIYAVGDIGAYKNKLKLILSGFAEAATACHDIYKIIYPDQIFHFEYSTSKGVS